MKKYILLLCSLILASPFLWSQGNCINVTQAACRFSCVPVTYTGSAPDTATYFWSSTCGTFTNPNQQNPGNLCLLFPGTCTLQVIVLQNGQAPDTCTAEIIVLDNPDGIMEGDTTICSGDCAPISVLFSSGTPPFTYQVDDGQFTNIYSSSTSFDTFSVCPLFSTTYTLLSITDGFGCTVNGQFNDVNITVVQGVSASITQNGAMLCANPPNQNYEWWNCDYTQLQSISQCLTLTQNSCYCLIVADANTSCVDTVCGDFTLPCTLTCGISAPDSVCFGDTVQLIYTGNAADSATLHWVLDVLSGAPITVDNEDTVNIVVDGIGCIYAELTVTEGNCTSICHDTVCTSPNLLFATLYNDIQTCDSCTTIPIGLSGTAPYTVYISDGSSVDTITGIMNDQFDYAVCPQPDTTYTYILVNATDSLSSCPVILGVDSILVKRYSTPVAKITRNNNVLCADLVVGDYAWYDSTYSELLSDSTCLALTQSGSYCLVVTNGTCGDTTCGDFIYDPCDLSCNIDLVPNACIGDSIVFAYTGNATNGAIFNWLIDLPGFPASPYSGDTVILVYSQSGCYQVSLTVFDQGCISTCADSICIDGPNSDASICCDEVRCDTCTDLSIAINGTPPWTIFIGHGTIVDTISGITSSPYLFHVCPPRDSTVTYTLLGVMDTINNCPGYITGVNTATIPLHPRPTASILQISDLLCANPPNMAGYGWYTCPAGGYIDTSRCFLPSVSGCYCVDVSDEYDCVDTACINIILSGVERLTDSGFSIHPNPSEDIVQIQVSSRIPLPCQWSMINSIGQQVMQGKIESPTYILEWPSQASPGIYILKFVDVNQQAYTTKLIHR
jgi:hypothetical protein